MKTAKEWAAEMAANLREDEGKWYADVLRSIIQRLVERVQADALGFSVAALHAKLSALVAVLDPKATPDADLPKGRGEPALRLAREALEVVERGSSARAPLEEEIARLRVENERLHAEHVEYLAFVAEQNDMRAEEHDQIRKANQ